MLPAVASEDLDVALPGGIGLLLLDQVQGSVLAVVAYYLQICRHLDSKRHPRRPLSFD
jgi:hypothetical protein